jgi:hypothetical protein
VEEMARQGSCGVPNSKKIKTSSQIAWYYLEYLSSRAAIHEQMILRLLGALPVRRTLLGLSSAAQLIHMAMFVRLNPAISGSLSSGSIERKSNGSIHFTSRRLSGTVSDHARSAVLEEIAKIRNIGIVAHIDAGKTTTSERFLYYSGCLRAIGNVDDGNTELDYLDVSDFLFLVL